MALLRSFIYGVFLHLVTLRAALSSADSVYGKGMRWCDNFCLCSLTSNQYLSCMQPETLYRSLQFSDFQVRRLNHVKWNPIISLNWCQDRTCLCNKESNKLFACIEKPEVLSQFIEEASLKLISQTENETAPVVRTAGLNLPGLSQSAPSEEYDQQITPEEDGGVSHRRRDSDEERRNRRRNRKNRKNKKQNRNEDELEEVEVTGSLEALPSVDETEVSRHPADDQEPEASMLPKQEAINSNPMVTAMLPPTRRQPIIHPTTAQPSAPQHHRTGVDAINNPRKGEEEFPHTQESSHPDLQVQNPSYQEPRKETEPSLEVPVQRKTVAGRVSEDLRQITEDIQHIRSDVIFNQRILLVTVGVAGVAMIGVVVLALLSCCSKKSSPRPRTTDNGRHDDSNHLHHPSSTATKVNLDEAW